MKIFFSILALSIASCSSQAGPPQYTSEAKLPENWPAPGPYNEAVVKQFPAYRAAFTTGNSGNFSFFKLFNHIKRNNIPMTAPVEMPIVTTSDGNIIQKGMAFLYQNQKVGSTGPAGKNINVRDILATRAVTYAWMGTDSQRNRSLARAQVDEYLAANHLKAGSYRLFGYNGPQTPRSERTYELQAMLK